MSGSGPRSGTPPKQDDDSIISLYIEKKPYASGRTDAYLKDSGVPVWAIVGHWKAVGKSVTTASGDYEIPESAVEAALAYYDRHQTEIDARLAENAV